jgi:mono/diheme cytochrome c family protein
MNKIHFPLMLTVGLALIGGLWAGLLRVGWQLPSHQADFALAHGVLMIGGFMGTLISLERAVALHNFLKDQPFRSLPYLTPLFSACGGVALWADLSLAAELMTLSSVGMVLMFAYIVRQQPAPYTITIGVGAACWLVGNLIWLGGNPLFASAPWWACFLILTIAGERLELSRLMKHTSFSTYLFISILALLLFSLLAIQIYDDLGWRLLGLAWMGLAIWLIHYDVAQRTILQRGLTRFIAACLLLGYVWLFLGGGLALLYGTAKVGMIYDAILHSIFLGFAFSMIFGHAALILPSIMGVNIAYSPLFYSHLVALHLTLLLRVGGDLSAWADGRRWGALLNSVVVILFFVNTARSLQSDKQQYLLSRSKPAYAVYGLVLPLVLMGGVLIGVGLAKSLGTEKSVSSPQETLSGFPHIGEGLYRSNCASCHGLDLQGVIGIGKSLIGSEFVASQTDAELQAFIIEGRRVWDTANTTGVEMPARGGNPALSGEQIRLIVEYIRWKNEE